MPIDCAFYGCSLEYNEYDNALYLGNSNNPYLVLVKAKETSILSCKINNTTKIICNNAFVDCSGLTSITIPDSVTSIDETAFQYCNRLANIYITDLYAWCNISGLRNLMEEGLSDKKLYLNNELITDLVIPESITSISEDVFRGCSELTSITIPNSVTSIGWDAFYGCSDLKTVYYTGTSEQWDCILIYWGNDELTSAAHYYYSESEPNLNTDGTAYDGNYWHYDENGNAVIWDYKA